MFDHLLVNLTAKGQRRRRDCRKKSQSIGLAFDNIKYRVYYAPATIFGWKELFHHFVNRNGISLVF
jgi:hypothetical protein